MSEISRWLDERRPPPPPELRTALDESLGQAGGADLAAALGVATDRLLGRALSATGRVRDSAFALLVADALLTYECEAALDEEDPESALSGVLQRVLEVSGTR